MKLSMILGIIVLLAGCAIPQQPSELPQQEANPLQVPEQSFDVIAREGFFEPDTITVPVGAKITIHVRSAGSAQGFSLPAYNINVPVPEDGAVDVEFVASVPGTFSFDCGQFCDAEEKPMPGTLIVQ